ncbi:hypothetical protein [Desulfatiferula olefinivorans]
MGGPGSGRKFRHQKPLTGEVPGIDIRDIKKSCGLIPGSQLYFQWARICQIHYRLNVAVHDGYLFLSFSSLRNGFKQQIDITYTDCHFGSQRPWFTCPHCGKRVAILYAGEDRFLCRVCSNITYASCNETPLERNFRKLNKLREIIGAERGAFHPLPLLKPKNMHEKKWVEIRLKMLHLKVEGVSMMNVLLNKNWDWDWD